LRKVEIEPSSRFAGKTKEKRKKTKVREGEKGRVREGESPHLRRIRKKKKDKR
jgi:hypothetical protein